MFLKPNAGLTIVDPGRKDFLPPEGREVGAPGQHGYYWERIIRDGDVQLLNDADAAKSLADAEAARLAAEDAAKKSAEKTGSKQKG